MSRNGNGEQAYARGLDMNIGKSTGDVDEQVWDVRCSPDPDIQKGISTELLELPDVGLATGMAASLLDELA